MKTILSTLVKRIAYGLILIVAVLVLNFFLIRLAPGDPADVIAGVTGGATEEMLSSIRVRYGLDKPLPVQLVIYLKGAAGGDLGQSYYYNAPVLDLILDRLWATILLVVCALSLAVSVGTLLGVIASLRPNGIVSAVVTTVSLIGFSLPVFWTGLMLIILFARIIPIFPVSGMRDIRMVAGSWSHLIDVLHHIVLPSVTLGIVYLAQYSRLARASMLEVLGSDYIRTAKAKGLGPAKIIFKHALRNAILPIITIVGLQLGGLLSGAVVVEVVFNWPGLGTLALDSILARDYPTVLGILLFAAVLVVIANQLTDFAYRLSDPRIRLG